MRTRRRTDREDGKKYDDESQKRERINHSIIHVVIRTPDVEGIFEEKKKTILDWVMPYSSRRLSEPSKRNIINWLWFALYKQHSNDKVTAMQINKIHMRSPLVVGCIQIGLIQVIAVCRLEVFFFSVVITIGFGTKLVSRQSPKCITSLSFASLTLNAQHSLLAAG